MMATSQTDSPEDAAADAAYKEAQNASWPPTKEDTKAIGAAAANAACHAAAEATYGVSEIAAQLGWCTSLGEYIGAAIYDIIDSFWADTVFVAPQYDHVIFQRLRRSAVRLAQLRLNVTRTPTQEQVTYELKVLEEWGVPAATLAAGAGPTGSQRGPWQPFFNELGLKDYLHKVASAESAIAAGITAKRNTGPTKKNSVGAIVVLGVVSIVGVGLIQKLVTRGKF